MEYDDTNRAMNSVELAVLKKMYENTKSVEVVLDEEDSQRIQSRRDSVNFIMNWYNNTAYLVTI